MPLPGFCSSPFFFNTPPTALVRAAVLAVELEPHLGAVIELCFRGAFDLREQHVDRVVGVHDLELRGGEDPFADLLTRVERLELAILVHPAPQMPAVTILDELAEVDHHEVGWPAQDRNLEFALLLARRVHLLHVEAGELAVDAVLAGDRECRELRFEERLGGGVVARLHVRRFRTREPPLLCGAAMTIDAERLVIFELAELRARL